MTPAQILERNAGARYSRIAKNGSTVTLYDGTAAGMDTEGGRWQTVCETHGSLVVHFTIRTARSHLPCPWAWCEGCQDPEVRP